MKLSQDEINHILFLTQVAADNNKTNMLREIIQCLIYIVKAHGEIELPVEAANHVKQIIADIEQELRDDTDRIQEIHRNLDQFARRRPFG